VNHLLDVWLSGSEGESKTVREKLDEKIDSYAAGELEYAADTILSIWEVSNQEATAPKEGPAPSNPAAPSWFTSWFQPPPEFTGYNMGPSLIKSIQEGSLLERKYWARGSREGKLEPVYFPCPVPEKNLGLDACKSPHSGDNARY